MACPVCGKDGVKDECPRCGTNLRALEGADGTPSLEVRTVSGTRPTRAERK